MSSIQPNNSNDYIASVLAQYLQQHQQHAQVSGNRAPGGQQQHHPSASTQVAEQQGGGLSSPLLFATFSSPTASTTASAQPPAGLFQGGMDPPTIPGTPGGFHQSQPPAPTPNFATNQPQEQQQQAPLSNMNSASLSQQILASAQLLAAINPNLAAAAVTHALSLSTQQPQQRQPQQHLPQPPQERQQQVVVHQNQTQQNKGLSEFISNKQAQQQFSNDPNALDKSSSVPVLPPPASALAQSGNYVDLIRDHLATSDRANSNLAPPAKKGARTGKKKQTTPETAQMPFNNLASLGAATAAPLISDPTSSLSYATPGNVAVSASADTLQTGNVSLKSWTLEQLEAHVKQLNDTRRPIPQSIAILLASARRKQEKHNAKKIANRKSASGSRARKKAEIDAMAQDNVRLRRHAIILSFLPDPVVAIGIDGEITFTSMQMERVLQHKSMDLIGANIEKFIALDSRTDFRRMIEDLVTAEEQAAMEEESDDTETGDDTDNDDGMVAGRNGSNNSSGSDPNVISLRSSEKSFPMLEVKLDSGEGTSDSSGTSLKPKFDTNQKSPFGMESNTGRDGAPPAKNAKVNVDDVMGASVTANNADAKLSSLHYHKNEAKKKDADLKSPPEKLQPCLRRKHTLAPRTSSSLTEKHECQSSSSDSSLSKTKGQMLNSSDSGYRESNGSPEDSNESSSSTMSNTDDYVVPPEKKVNRTLPLAPACNICLVRKDLSTVWCELTASIRTRSISDGDFEAVTLSQRSKTSSSAYSSDGEMKEMLLCFRPVLEGPKVGEQQRFSKRVKIMSPHEVQSTSSSDNHKAVFSKVLKKGNKKQKMSSGDDCKSV